MTHRTYLHYLAVTQCCVPAIINFVLNAGIAWLVFPKHNVLALYPEESIFSPCILGDTIATVMFLTFFVCLSTSFQTKKQIDTEVLQKIRPLSRNHLFESLIPQNIFVRSCVFAAVALVLFIPITYMCFLELQITGMSFWQFFWFKSLYATMLAIFVAPVSAWIVLTNRLY